MHIQALRLEGSETVGDLQELLAYGGQMGKAFPEPEVGEIVRADLIAQEGRELLVLLEEPELHGCNAFWRYRTNPCFQ